MAKLSATFYRYVAVGVLNTLVHWGVFALLFYLAACGQASSNLAGFAVAVTFSFFVNAHVTFGSRVTLRRYVLYVAFMALLAFAFGALAEQVALPPLFTLVGFSLTSLVCGFIYANFIVFKEED